MEITIKTKGAITENGTYYKFVSFAEGINDALLFKDCYEKADCKIIIRKVKGIFYAIYASVNF